MDKVEGGDPSLFEPNLCGAKNPRRGTAPQLHKLNIQDYRQCAIVTFSALKIRLTASLMHMMTFAELSDRRQRKI